jgi:hypothetical protein
MSVTAKLYPSFLSRIISNDSYNFSLDGDVYSIDCKASLYTRTNDFSQTSVEYNVSNVNVSELNVNPLIEGSVKNIKLYYERNGSDIKFWLEEATWTDIPDETTFNRVIVYQDPGLGAGLLVMWIALDEDHTVDGSFKLRKATGGEIKITFS